MKAFSLLFAVVVLMFLTVCSDKPSVPISGPENSVIVPLAVGNKWTGTQVDGWIGSDDTTCHVKTIEVIDEIVIDDERWYRTRRILDDDTLSSNQICCNRANGLWVNTMDDVDTYGEPYLLAKYPAEAGDTYWLGDYDGSPYVTVISVDSSIEVPYGTFRCYCYVLQSPDIIDVPVVNFCYAPNVGFVKDDLFGGFSGVHNIWQLASFAGVSSYRE
jgi:hypothetical protein